MIFINRSRQLTANRGRADLVDVFYAASKRRNDTFYAVGYSTVEIVIVRIPDYRQVNGDRFAVCRNQVSPHQRIVQGIGLYTFRFLFCCWQRV